MNKETFEITIKNIDLDGYEYEQELAKGKVTTSNILNSISALKVREVLENHNIKLEDRLIMGTVIEIDEDDCSAIIGHEGSDCGNIKTVHQVSVHWKKAAA